MTRKIQRRTLKLNQISSTKDDGFQLQNFYKMTLLPYNTEKTMMFIKPGT